MPESKPKVIIIGGPNGAGKAAIAAGRIMLARLKELAADRASFAFETTLASRSFARWIAELRDESYDFHLFYYWVPSPEFSISRVALRVEEGGHHVPADTIRRRYFGGIRNFFELYRPLATGWRCYNSSVVGNQRSSLTEKEALMRGSTISKSGRKSSAGTTKRSKPAKSINKMMQEVDGEIDRAIQQAAREAAIRHIRDGRNVPVSENGKVVWKPAAEALAEADAAVAAGKKAKRK